MSKLNERQRKFASEYIIDFNATQAAKRAGYSERTAYSQGQRLLKHVEIKKAIDENLNEQEEALRKRFSSDAVVARKIMFNILNDKKARDQDKISVAKDFLDRAGFKPTEKLEHSGEMDMNHNPFSDLTTDELKKLIKDD